MTRSALIDITRQNIAHVKADTIEQEPDVFRVPASHYTDAARWQLEVDRVFKRMPLMLAPSCEVAEPGSYKAMVVADVPVLIARGSDGEIRAFVNMCSHRGAQVMPEGTGTAKRFICPYHAWTYDQKGALVGILSKDDFGEIDRSCHGLIPLPAAERAGLIWVCLQPDSSLDIDTFLSGYDAMLANFGFESWHLVDRRSVKGPNWKIAYDGYLDLYHLPILHKETFGSQMPNRALYHSWGPHQMVTSPNPAFLRLEDVPEDEWNTAEMMLGVFTIFPHISIASFYAGGRGVLLSQLFPGQSAGESVTVQSYLMADEPSEEGRAAAIKQMDLLEYVVREEDYATGLRQQQGLATGLRKDVLFGRNEGGGHRFHRFVDQLLELGDSELGAAFSKGSPKPNG